MADDVLDKGIKDVPSDLRDLELMTMSLNEELKAVSDYKIRAQACQSPELRQIFLHNAEEEIEHAIMLIEWTRRNHPDFAEKMKEWSFTDEPLTH